MRIIYLSLAAILLLVVLDGASGHKGWRGRRPHRPRPHPRPRPPSPSPTPDDKNKKITVCKETFICQVNNTDDSDNDCAQPCPLPSMECVVNSTAINCTSENITVGVCQTLNCSSDSDCPNGTVCFGRCGEGNSECLVECSDNKDCGNGYICSKEGFCKAPKQQRCKGRWGAWGRWWHFRIGLSCYDHTYVPMNKDACPLPDDCSCTDYTDPT